MIMKRYLSFIIALVMCLSLAACGNTPAETETTVPATESVEVTEPAAEDPVLTARREQVLEKMRSMQTIYWQVEEPIKYTKNNDSDGIENDPTNAMMLIQPGRIYQGIPYTHASGSEEAFLDYAVSQDERGVYTIAGLETGDLSGNDGRSSVYYPRIGNDCADAVFWAWATVANSIDFTMSYYMTEAHGCIPVGEYKTSYDEYVNTTALCEENGLDVMCEAYSQLRPGDAVVKGREGGHAMMVSEVCVVRNPDGTIDSMNSYLKVVDQTSGELFSGKTKYDETLQTDVYYCGGVDRTSYFYKLFSKGYVPVTIKELIDPTPLEEEYAEMTNTELSLENLYAGNIKSNRRISLVRITITDANGEEVQTVTCYGREAEMYDFVIDRFTWETEQDSLQGGLDLDALPAGSYTVTYTCTIATKQTFTVGSFTFEK